MGRGLGKLQRAVLDAIAASEYAWVTTSELAEATGAVPREVRRAVRALEARGLVTVEHGSIDWNADAGPHGMPVSGLQIGRPRDTSAAEANAIAFGRG